MKQIIPHLIVNNVNESIQFYSDKLGFKADYIQKDTNGNENFAILKNGSVEIMLGYQTSELKKLNGFDRVGASAIFYFEMDDVNSYYNQIKDNVKIIRDLGDTRWGTREFWIEDCNNYYLSFYKSL